MRRNPSSILLVVSLAGAVLAAACGGGGASAPPAQEPSSAASAPGQEAASPGTIPSTPASPSATPSSSPGTPAEPVGVAGGPMKPVAASTLTAGFPSGLDAKRLPPLAKLEPKKLREVMKLFTKALGAKCSDCHVEGDFAAPTRRKKIAEKMWDEYVVKLTMADDGPVFCDTCHQGQLLVLDRHDKKAVGQWMHANFVEKLKRADGAENGCKNESCHGASMDLGFLKRWGGER